MILLKIIFEQASKLKLSPNQFLTQPQLSNRDSDAKTERILNTDKIFVQGDDDDDFCLCDNSRSLKTSSWKMMMIL